MDDASCGSKAQTSPTSCKKHPIMFVTKFCQTCWELFCPECETSFQHVGHEILAKPVCDAKTPRACKTPGLEKDREFSAESRSPVFERPSGFGDYPRPPPLMALYQQPQPVRAAGTLNQLQNGSGLPYEDIVRQLNHHYANSPRQPHRNSGGRVVREYIQPRDRRHIQPRPLLMVRDIGGRQNSLELAAQVGFLGWPKGFTVDPEGNVVVADCSNNRIQVFKPDGAFLKVFGFPGVVPGCVNGPFKVAAVREPRENAGFVYAVCDHAPEFFGGEDIARYVWALSSGRGKANKPGTDRAGRIQIFECNGVYRRQLVMTQVMKITSVEGFGQTLFVVDGGQNRVIAFQNYVVAYTISFCGRVVELSEICLYDDVMYACDYKGHRVVAVDLKTQQTVSEFGDEALAFPNGISIDGGANRIMVADSHNNRLRVTVFSLDTYAYKEQFIYQGDKVSHIVGLKMLNDTKQLVVLNRPGKDIVNIAGHVLVLSPLDWLAKVLPGLVTYLAAGTNRGAGVLASTADGNRNGDNDDEDAAGVPGSLPSNGFPRILPSEAGCKTKVGRDALLYNTPPQRQAPHQERDSDDDLTRGNHGYGSSGSSFGSLPLLRADEDHAYQPADAVYGQGRLGSLPASPPPRSFVLSDPTGGGAVRGARRSLSFGESTATGGAWGHALPAGMGEDLGPMAFLATSTPIGGGGGSGGLLKQESLYSVIDAAVGMGQGSNGATASADNGTGAGTAYDSIEEAFSKWSGFN